MVHRLILADHVGNHWESVPLAIGLFLAVLALVALCAKHTRRGRVEEATQNVKYVQKSSSKQPKQLATKMGRKAMAHNKRCGKEVKEIDEGGFGGGGLWQKAILMGEKCRPPEFAGAIYYDSYGNQVTEAPVRSPRASPLYNFSYLHAQAKT